MSVRTLPILFINLGGEMLYIIDQRLRAQTIQKDKSTKVLNDIVNTMFNKKFIEELFKPQNVYNKNSLYSLFDKLAHTSIMRLNSASMDKLYDLMMMAFKYQVLMCPLPSDLLLVTLNHLDGIRKLISSPGAINQIEFVYYLLMKNFKSFTSSEFQYLRHNLLNFFQGLHIRVSMFLKINVQKPNGHFIVPVGGKLPYGVSVPGTIRTFDASGKIIGEENFNSGYKYTNENRRSSISPSGDRVIILGTNMYVDGDNSKCFLLGVEQDKSGQSVSESSNNTVKENSYFGNGQNELTLLSQLLGNQSKSSNPSMMFTLNLASSESNECPINSKAEKVINIDARQKSSSELDSIIDDLDIQDSSCKDELDLLDLMDS